MSGGQARVFELAIFIAAVFLIVNLLCVTGALTGHAGHPHWIAAYITLSISWGALIVAILASHLIVRR